MAWGQIAAGVIGLGSSLLSSSSSKKAARAQAAAATKAAQLFEGIEIPTIEEQQIILQNPELMGEYTPEQLQAMRLSVAGISEIGPETKTVAAQQEALDEYSEMAEGGLTEADLAARRDIGRDVSQSARARQRSILNEMAQRGTLGSGMELAAQLSGEQRAASQEAEASDRLIQQNEAARRAALAQKASLAGQMRGQESTEAMDKYRAQKAIEKFNLGLKHQDASERNRAQLINLQARQAAENERARLANEQMKYNKELQQQQFQNQMDRARSMADAYTGQGQAQSNIYKQQAQRTAGMGSGLANMFSALGSYDQKQADDAKAHERAVELAQIKNDPWSQ